MKPIPWPGSLRTRLMLVMVAGLLLALVASNLIHWRDRDRFAREMNIEHYLERVAAAVRLLDGGEAERRADILSVMQTPLFRVQMLDGFPSRRGIRVSETPLSREVEDLLRDRLDRDEVIFRIASMPRRDVWPPRRDGDHRPFARAQQGFVAVVALADGATVQFALRMPEHAGRWPIRLLISMLVLLLAAIVLSGLAVRSVLRPLRRVAEQAEQIGRDLETAQMPESGPSEVRRVAVAMNSMQEKLRQLFEQRSRFLAAVSHDLRTPITRLRLRAESIDDEALRHRIQSDLEEMERMVQETLEFMRDDAKREPTRKVDLDAMLEAIVEDMAGQAGNVEFRPQQRLVVETRPLALKRCIENLLSNAARYAKHVELCAERTSSGVRIRILDDGPGIPEHELSRVFEPFYRLDKARGDGGSGLGLSIARAIVDSLGGSLTLRNRDGGGLEAVIALPVAAVD